MCCFHIHGDFTPVCTTEFIAFSRANTYFQNLNTCLIGLSVDSNPSHLAWTHDIYVKTGIIVPFPVIADRSGEIARQYGMISNTINVAATVRNVYIIDDKGIVRTILIYPMNVGRCVPEILRVVEALQTADCNETATPANWIPGEPIIISAPSTFEELRERKQKIEREKNGISWYLSFKESNCSAKNLQNIENKKNESKNQL